LKNGSQGGERYQLKVYVVTTRHNLPRDPPACEHVVVDDSSTRPTWIRRTGWRERQRDHRAIPLSYRSLKAGRSVIVNTVVPFIPRPRSAMARANPMLMSTCARWARSPVVRAMARATSPRFPVGARRAVQKLKRGLK